MPKDAERPPQSVDALNPEYFEWLERYSHVLYPALGLLTLALMAAGILRAWRSSDLHGLQKAELRRDVIQLLRRNVAGMSAEQLGKELGLPPLKLLRLLEAMQSDGQLRSHTNPQRLTVWNVSGVGPS